MCLFVCTGVRWSVLGKIRWGSSSASSLKDPQRQLDEAVTLVNTLPGFRVAESAVIGVDYNTKRRSVWGPGQIEKLVRMKQQSRVTALMVNVDMLTPLQQHELFSIFQVPIYDRYNIVLSIFKHYAKTPEAHLQIQLAEIPYIRNRLHYLNKYRSDPSALHTRLEIQRVWEECYQLGALNTMLHVMTCCLSYTNAGKTSLVKCLTGASSLEPKDRLFATLDTTRHLARLPSGRKVVFTDTIGFLSDLPMHLLAAFQATLSHVKLADVIIHIRDISNPDWRAQSEDVEKTLEAIGLPTDRLKDVVVADNKIDVDGAPPSSTPNAIRISCKSSEGVEGLIEEVDKVCLCFKYSYFVTAALQDPDRRGTEKLVLWMIMILIFAPTVNRSRTYTRC
ncbi:unnamed protein product [Heligmosomoides polygyrus]|uniref:Hflx-type G domain-containing protein n=1 Tax=Heligmosomoides polygyrus TaxID=6339 RepID=A0A183FIE3_HELPZ|nr:unnamed protein product [Heligmosomoides polygyrus]